MRCGCFCSCTLRISRHRLPRTAVNGVALQFLHLCTFSKHRNKAPISQRNRKRQNLSTLLSVGCQRVKTAESFSVLVKKLYRKQFVDCFVKSARKYLRRVGNYSDCQKYKRATSPSAKRRMNTLNRLSGTSGQTVIASFPVALHLKHQE
jgi:hypothetical protein